MSFSDVSLGIIRLRHRFTDSTIASYWLPVRLTRYRARPAHTFVHLHVSIQDDNFYVPQCVDIYQSLKLYEYSIPHSVVRVQAVSSHWPADLHYSLITENIQENFFSVNSSTGHVDVLPSFRTSPSTSSRYFLTVRAFDRQQYTSVDCFLDIQLFRRRQLTPKFLHPSVYNLDLLEIAAQSGRLRQRLFQVIAVLDEQVYASDLEVRYRIVDSPEHFLINPQTGYIAAKQALLAQSTYDLYVSDFSFLFNSSNQLCFCTD